MKDKATGQNKKGAMHIGQVIRRLLKSYRMQEKFEEATLIAHWNSIVGRSIAKRTKRVFIRNATLFVEMESPTLKHDLHLLKNQILEIIHREFGNRVIRKIVLLLLVMAIQHAVFPQLYSC